MVLLKYMNIYFSGFYKNRYVYIFFWVKIKTVQCEILFRFFYFSQKKSQTFQLSNSEPNIYYLKKIKCVSSFLF